MCEGGTRQAKSRVTHVGKSKRAPALFEVIEPRQLQGGSSRFPLPKWWRGEKASSPTYPAAGQPEEKAAAPEKIIKLVPQFDRPKAQEKLSVPPSTRAETSLPPTPSSAKSPTGRAVGVSDGGSVTSGGKPPAVALDKGRVQLSLNPVSLCIAFGVLLVVVIGAFQIGRDTSGSAPRKDDIAAADQKRNPAGGDADKRKEPSAQQGALVSGTPTPPVVHPAVDGRRASGPSRDAARGSARPPVADAEPRSPEATRTTVPRSNRVKGLNYLFIVRFRSENLDDAAHAHKWLASKGIETALDDGGDWLSLVSVDGFDMSNPDHKAKRLALEAKLKDLTPAYRQDCRSEQRYLYYAFDKPELRKQKD